MTRSFLGTWAHVGLLALGLSGMSPAVSPARAAEFEGRFFAGEGDREYLELLDIARRMFDADAEWPNLTMLYTPAWNGLVEGPTWGAWWVQNSYGTTYAALPFYEEPFVRFVQNSQDLWFDQMGDGKTSYVWNGKDRWVPPDGCLMDCANETWAMHRQGDGRVSIHDWGMEFTAAGGVMQSELLLISRDRAAVDHYLPRLERCAEFIETRRDPQNDLFLAGPAGNLLAPSYAGYKRPDGTYAMAYLAGLSVTHIAFLDRLIELEKLAGRPAQAERWSTRRASARAGLERLMTPEGYLVKSLDPDGTLHGVYGAPRHGYFEASPNHDALCFRVVDDAQAQRIYRQIAALPGLRPHGLVVANYPSLDDMYEAPEGLWGFGTWVNGGHWTTCEVRMILGYYRVGAYEDARRAMKQILTFARQFRMDNPLVAFGSAVYQPGEPINLTYDAFGAPAALVRGLFEYQYRADGLTLVPHLPDGITRLEQKFPIRFGSKRLYLATAGHGPITAVTVNGKRWKSFTAQSVFLPYAQTPEVAVVQILAGGAQPPRFAVPKPDRRLAPLPTADQWPRSAAPGVIAATELPLRLGADSQGGSRFVGDFARVGVFDRALSAAEIAALSQNEPGAVWRDPAVVGHWQWGALSHGAFSNATDRAPAARIVGQVETIDSPFGKAVHLRGEGYLEVANGPALTLAQGGTWYALVRPATTQGRLIDKCPVGGATGYTFDTHPGNALRLITDAGAIAHDAKLTPDQWVHVAATVDANGTSTLYVNGTRVASSPRQTSEVELRPLLAKAERIRRFHQALVKAGHADTYEAAHARWAVRGLLAAHERVKASAAGRGPRLPARSAEAADRVYLSTAAKLCDGLSKAMDGYSVTTDRRKRQSYALWQAAGRD